MVLEDLEEYMQNNETRAPTHTIHQITLKMDKRLKHKSWHHISPRGKHRWENFRYPNAAIFLLIDPLGQGKQREKINKWDYIKLKSFCTAKEIISKIKREPTI